MEQELEDIINAYSGATDRERRLAKALRDAMEVLRNADGPCCAAGADLAPDIERIEKNFKS